MKNTEKVRNRLPIDLRQAALRFALRRIALCAVLVVILGVVLLLWGDRLLHTENRPFQISGYVAILLLPFLLTGLPFSLVDRTWYGVIQRVDIKTTVDNSTPTQPTRNHNYIKNTVWLSILCSDGKWIYEKAYEGRAEWRRGLSKYCEGDAVFHLYGSGQIIVLPKADDTQVQCAVCGEVSDKEADVCRACGHTLVKK